MTDLDPAELRDAVRTFTALAQRRRSSGLNVEQLITHQRLRAQLCAATGQTDPEQACAQLRQQLDIPQTAPGQSDDSDAVAKPASEPTEPRLCTVCDKPLGKRVTIHKGCRSQACSSCGNQFPRSKLSNQKCLSCRKRIGREVRQQRRSQALQLAGLQLAPAPPPPPDGQDGPVRHDPERSRNPYVQRYECPLCGARTRLHRVRGTLYSHQIPGKVEVCLLSNEQITEPMSESEAALPPCSCQSCVAAAGQSARTASKPVKEPTLRVRPLTYSASESVRTVSGGLPSHGRRY
ncbi:hypothetical protein [Kutzneria buriramensis]|uniref:Uncharacterized protein n=1 Tax=Kutzneria buriramensis TaxID=1045776 RepID=A0A3E0I9E7_9PSEU|nr:hypothetical protein [Kutzneria buriramensis]REH55231.1 hypothetical protein BCF44_101248 [Kutzneria buriramensis]